MSSIWSLPDLIEHARSTTTYRNGKWVPARPLQGPLIWRVRAAWNVLCGHADAFIWPEGQYDDRFHKLSERNMSKVEQNEVAS